jgi:hypothetical protein
MLQCSTSPIPIHYVAYLVAVIMLTLVRGRRPPARRCRRRAARRRRVSVIHGSRR